MYWLQIILLSVLIGQPPTNMIESALKSLRELDRPHSEFIAVPEITRLDKVYNEIGEKINKIRSEHPDFAGQQAELLKYSESAIFINEREYVSKTCVDAFSDNPKDWDTIRRCFYVSLGGMKDHRIADVAEKLVVFDSVPTQSISKDQLMATLTALVVIARSKTSGSETLLERCADGSVWDGKSLQSTQRPDVRELLQSRAILCLSALPIESGKAIVARLEMKYPPALATNSGRDSKKSFFVALVKEDLRRQAELRSY